MNEVDLSIIIPVGKRNNSFAELAEAYEHALRPLGLSYEVIVVLDGIDSAYLDDFPSDHPFGSSLQVVQLARSFGEATALMAGFERARGRQIMTLPAYWQVLAEDIPLLFKEKGGNQLVIARRWPRRGGTLETLRRNVFHGLVKFVTKAGFQDLGCGVRLMDREVLETVHLYGDQHRFLPVVAGRQGFRIAEVDLRQEPKDNFEGRYGFRDYLRRILDIVTIFFLARFTKKPLRFFGTIGASIFVLGAVVLVFIVGQRVFFDVALANRPALLLSTLFVVLGIQIFSLGLIGELIIFTHARSIKEYQIEKIVN